MNKEINNFITQLLDSYKEGKLSREEFCLRLREIYFEDIGFAKVDHHRSLRKGFPEVIYGQNKTPAQILAIAKKY